MTDVYQKLATHLDNLPAGFPATESGVELRILKRLFTPEEAEIATHLIMMPEPPASIAARVGRDEAELAPMLEAMSKKGLIFRTSKDEQKYYMASQFVVGIWEYHLNDLDEDLIRDVNEYLPHVMKEGWVDRETKQMRVIPISQSITAEMAVMPYEVAEEIIKKQSKILVAPCICRREHDMVGKGCGKPMETCLVFGGGAHYYADNGLGRFISQEEALAVLKTGLEAGLVLQPGNSRKPMNICMCCGCCCQILKNLRNIDSPAKAVHSNYYAEVDEENCTACGACVERCQMDAITVEDTAQINLDRCIGCGLCVTDCPTDAMTLRQKGEADQYVPPKNVVETYMNMARERGIM
ncbi:4Fe-4S ferredoxin [Desulfonema ishimotonii]|uniref:4Fe-4S ferredoxin n=1 Tax=Desulfonema ishimotonii TaxID=45657 RepID=A0A401G2Z1_9BACT|nr:4Fe-4S binding protein [Desulfonema ishimotonii]GBC63553.1 4Fe-4S ferredoxin [Desulfonema ishimotonii]